MPTSVPITPLVSSVAKAESSIYVYDHPAVDWSRLVDCYRQEHGVAPWMDEEREHAQNMAEVWVHQALLRHPRRTHDPESASLFYVPLYVAVSSNAEPHLGSLSCGGQTHQGRMSEALDYLESESTYFMQYGGSNHFFVCGSVLRHEGNDERRNSILECTTYSRHTNRTQSRARRLVVVNQYGG